MYLNTVVNGVYIMSIWLILELNPFDPIFSESVTFSPQLRLQTRTKELRRTRIGKLAMYPLKLKA